MQTEQPKKHKEFNDYHFSLKVIILLVSLEVLILVCISFVKIYIDKKHNIVSKMRDEVEIVEKIFTDDIDYSSYVLSQVAELVRTSHGDKNQLDSIMHHYAPNFKDKKFFGWDAFYWLDKNHIVENSNGNVVYSIGTNLSYLSSVQISALLPEKVIHSHHPDLKERFSLLDLVYGVTDKNGNFLGTLLLQIDSSAILENLELYRRNNFTNFAIIDNRMNILLSYPISAKFAEHKNSSILDQNLLDVVSKFNFNSKVTKERYQIKIFSGENFFARKIKNKPYVLVATLDPDKIKATFTKKVGLKFLEILILASFFLAIILMIYKRETWLRAKAERASHLATKAMIAKSDFLSYTAHEVRSPLGFILTGSEIMAKKLFGPVPKAYEDYVQGIHNNAKLILEFINDILDEKNLASGNFKLEEGLCDIYELLDRAIQTNKTRFHDRKIEIEVKLQNNLPYIFGDKRKLLQIFNNLISNSYKYSLDHTKITIRIKKLTKKLKIIISDQGIGMTEEDIKIALTKHGKVHDKKTNLIIDSYGLGLPIVLMLVKAHDGIFHIKSKVNQGTIIEIIFPEKRLVTKEEGKEE